MVQNKSQNIKHQLFVDEYMTSLNATEAYQKVYGVVRATAATRGAALLQNVYIKENIEKKQAEYRKLNFISKEQLIKDLIDIKNDNKKKSPQVALKAAEQLVKMLGYNQPDEVITTTKTIRVVFKDDSFVIPGKILPSE